MNLASDSVEFERQTQGQVLIALRRIGRAIDLHSRQLIQKLGLTGLQIVVLRANQTNDYFSRYRNQERTVSKPNSR